METEKPDRADHGDDIDRLIGSRPTKRANAPLENIREDSDGQRRAHSTPGRFPGEMEIRRNFFGFHRFANNIVGI